jgi:hypothetical protein
MNRVQVVVFEVPASADPGLHLGLSAGIALTPANPLRMPFPGVDETPQPGERAADLVVRLARLKALAVAERTPTLGSSAPIR